MITQGEFKYFIEGVEVDKSKLKEVDLSNCSTTIKDLSVFYSFLPKIEDKEKNLYQDCINNSLNKMDLKDLEDCINYLFRDSEKRDKIEGIKHNKGKLPLDTMITKQFPNALEAVCKATQFGHQKYIKFDKDYLNFLKVEGGSQTYADAGQRHNLHKNEIDKESKLPHIYLKCWNALAELELWIQENKNK
jgi:hypothetical protein